jgi:tRNA threonylcarbamoyl adenosine modification protein (Sua5/YciO/YrdC/YwlC family)
MTVNIKKFSQSDLKFANEFLSAFNANKVCLHPSDTIPGLTCHPYSQNAINALKLIKQERKKKVFISLVKDFQTAKKYWMTLPGKWDKIIAELWPNLLTIIWKATDKAPSSLIASDGSIALRCPKFECLPAWFGKVLLDIDTLLLTTSVNNSNCPALVNWDEAVKFLESYGGFVPSTNITPSGHVKASTVIKIEDACNYILLREGACKKNQIDDVIAKYSIC